MKNDLKTERRKFTRFKAPFYVNYTLKGSPSTFSAISTDISMGGLRIFVEKNLDILVDNCLELSLLIPPAPLKVLTKVVWIKELEDKKELGLVFINIPDIYKEEIFNYIFKYYRSEINQKWWQS